MNETKELVPNEFQKHIPKIRESLQSVESAWNTLIKSVEIMHFAVKDTLEAEIIVMDLINARTAMEEGMDEFEAFVDKLLAQLYSLRAAK